MQPPEDGPSEPTLSRELLWILTLTTVLTAGNVYLLQPLLGEIARFFQKAPATAGLVPVLTQTGYVTGLFFLTPLGDILNRRKMILSLLILAALALFGSALAPNFALFAAAAFAIGVTSTVVQVIIPVVGGLSAPAERARNLGIVVAGALIGILLSRTFSGFIAARLGWRGVFWIAGLMMLVLAVLLVRALPTRRSRSGAALNYPQLLASLWQLFRDLPELRAVAVNGALLYAALSAFWASLAFYLESDVFHLGVQAAGAFGLVGAVGALSATLVGRLIAKLGSRKVLRICMLFMGGAFVVMAAAGSLLAGLVAGVILLDLGAQAATVSNQTQIYAFHPQAQARLNTIYKIIYFIGGATGSALSALAWQQAGWRAVCGVGLAFVTVAALWESRTGKPETRPSE